MIDKTLRIWADIDLNAIEHNYREIRRKLEPYCRFLGVMKANAYGHGAQQIAWKLQELGANYLSAAFIDEAEHLRNVGITLPILVFGYTPPGYARELRRLRLTQTISDVETARLLSRELEGSEPRLRVHIKIDSGMGRLGFRFDDPQLIEHIWEIIHLPGLEVEGIFSHFAESDAPETGYTELQYGRFAGAVEALEREIGYRFKIKHCANSGAVINYPQYCLDMVRPGLALYGMYPAAEQGGLELRSALELRTRVTHIFDAEPGDSISYGRAYTAADHRRIAVLGIGYADGLPRVLSNNMDVLVRGRRAPQVGRICMDMSMIDITGIPDCALGDAVTIFGRDGDANLPIEEQASGAGTISYEILCGLSERVQRCYHGF